jgi:hypothetical protein
VTEPTSVPTVVTVQPSVATDPGLTIQENINLDYKGQQLVYVKISHYEPWVGGTNCASFVNGECVSHMASGKHWQDYMDVAIACPKNIPFNTQVIIDGKKWLCLDRGGAIVNFYEPKLNAHVFWVDELTDTASHPFGTVHEAIMILP